MVIIKKNIITPEHEMMMMMSRGFCLGDAGLFSDTQKSQTNMISVNQHLDDHLLKTYLYFLNAL